MAIVPNSRKKAPVADTKTGLNIPNANRVLGLRSEAQAQRTLLEPSSIQDKEQP